MKLVPGVMLNKAKCVRLRSSRGRGQNFGLEEIMALKLRQRLEGQGQGHCYEAEAKISTLRGLNISDSWHCSIQHCLSTTLLVIVTGIIARSATRQYLSYSEVDFEVFCPKVPSSMSNFTPSVQR